MVAFPISYMQLPNYISQKVNPQTKLQKKYTPRKILEHVIFQMDFDAQANVWKYYITSKAQELLGINKNNGDQTIGNSNPGKQTPGSNL